MISSPSLPIAIHLIPYDGIGGVEAAARSLPSGAYPGLRLQKCFLAKQGGSRAQRTGDHVGAHSSENDPRNYTNALLWLHRLHPQLLIASLWRSYAVLVLHKLLHPHCQVVCFLHCARAVHPVDRFLSLAAMAVATEIWTDSQSTLMARVPTFMQGKARVISFMLQRLQPVSQVLPAPSFVFWGRLAPQKGLDRSLRIIAALKSSFADVQFLIIGPDRGEQTNLQQLSDRLCLSNSVTFLGPKSSAEIQGIAHRSSFYLQPSVFEGMAISVVEAMQLGLVPIVTAVGEMARYCQDGENALLINPDHPQDTAARIQSLLDQPNHYALLRKQAIRTWSDTPIYQDQLLERCRALLSASPA